MARQGDVQRSATPCLTCRKRRVKCDRNRPACQRCITGRFVCRGYEDKFKFVNTSSSISPSSQEVTPPLHDNDGESTAGSASSGGITCDETELVVSAPSMSPELAPSAWFDLACLSFTLSNLFRGRPTMQQDSKTPNPSFLEIAALSRSDGEADGISALCAAYFGKQHHLPTSVHTGRLRYGKALAALNTKLRDPTECLSENTLRDTMVLITYELVAGTSKSAWLQHASGMAQLMQLRGPEAFASPLELEILRACRALIIMHCIVLRRPCFLSQKAWLLRPMPTGPLEAITDLMCFVPELMSEADALRSRFLAASNMPEDDKASIQFRSIVRSDLESLNLKIQRLIGELFLWRFAFLQDYGHTISLVPSIRAVDSGNPSHVQSPFKTSIHFNHLFHANGHMIYGAIFICLYQLGTSISPDFTPAEGYRKAIELQAPNKTTIGSLPLTLPSPTLRPEDLAPEMCQIVEYHLSGSHSRLGAFDLIFPLRVLGGALDPRAQPEVCTYISSVLRWISQKESFSVAEAKR